MKGGLDKGWNVGKEEGKGMMLDDRIEEGNELEGIIEWRIERGERNEKRMGWDEDE